MSTGAVNRVVIVGGVAGGASAAARLRRVNTECSVILFERGEYVSFANCGMPYHIGGTIKERDRLLLVSPDTLRRRFDIDVRIRTEVISIDAERKEILARALTTGVEERVPYDALILSPGASPVKPPIPGIDHPRVRVLRDISTMDSMKTLVDAEVNKTIPRPILILGGGYIGLEVAEAIIHRKLPCILVEFSNQVMGPIDPEMSYPLHQELNANNVDLRLGCTVSKFVGTDTSVLCTLTTGEEIECAFAVVAIGVRPETELAKTAGLSIGQRGGILVDEFLQTSNPSIYAVGDAVEVQDFVTGTQAHIPLAGPANRQGRIVATNLFCKNPKFKLSYKKTQGTAVCKVFDLTVAMTGANEKLLKRLNKPYNKVYLHSMSHASYYPGAQLMCIKLIYDPESMKILGAQAVGKEGVEKRIDVIAVALRGGLTINDLEDLELCYAPPYGSAKDPVNMAGFIASNLERGMFRQCFAEDLHKKLSDGGSDLPFILDVREPEETTQKIPQSINIPLAQVVSRLHEIPKDRPIVVTCASGLRSYNATMTLLHNGYNAQNLSGGFKIWSWVTGNDPKKWIKPISLPPPSCQATTSCQATSSCTTVSPSGALDVAKEVDAMCMACPGPIVRLAKAMNDVKEGEVVRLRAGDRGFAQDIVGWCKSTSNTLVKMDTEEKPEYCVTVLIRKGTATKSSSS
ncbi:pyridine nucleotide-disulfide oxidoreductase [Pelomyxa schiedti]|nr:pyridine nucleotide-disulfide oxidoreductase [Pelomyxa schiedti]